MEARVTNRGFNIIEFRDSFGIECSLQESSSAEENKIWLGCDRANPRYTVDGVWIDVELPEHCVCNTRMHLTREQVRDLLPYLRRFVDTGELC